MTQLLQLYIPLVVAPVDAEIVHADYDPQCQEVQQPSPEYDLVKQLGILWREQVHLPFFNDALWPHGDAQHIGYALLYDVRNDSRIDGSGNGCWPVLFQELVEPDSTPVNCLGLVFGVLCRLLHGLPMALCLACHVHEHGVQVFLAYLLVFLDQLDPKEAIEASSGRYG